METKTIHRFEAAGLGKAPFSYVGFEEKYINNGDGTTRAGASCAYCSTAIRNVFKIRSADGILSGVGCECIAKVGDEGLKKVVKKAVAVHKRQVRSTKDNARIDAAKLKLEQVRVKLAEFPHIDERMAEKGKTLADYVDWMFLNAGTSGKVAASKIIEKIPE